MPSPHHSQPSPTIPGSYPQPQVIHVIHHSAHHSKHDTKKKSKARSGSVERGRHSPHLPSHKLSHSFSTSQLNLSLSAPRPIPFPKAPSHPGSHSHHQRTPSQPNTPAQVHYSDLPSVAFERQPSTSNVLQKRRPAISLSSTQQIIHPQLTPHSPNFLQLPASQKPLHGILKNKNSTQQLAPLNANFQYSRCTGRKKAVCVCFSPSNSNIYLRSLIDRHKLHLSTKRPSRLRQRCPSCTRLPRSAGRISFVRHISPHRRTTKGHEGMGQSPCANEREHNPCHEMVGQGCEEG